MIKKVVKYTDNWQSHPLEVFNCMDMEKNEITDYTYYCTTDDYYLFHCSDCHDRYQLIVNLRYVDVCIAEKHDKLTKYGFKLIREIGDYKLWVRQRRN